MLSYANGTSKYTPHDVIAGTDLFHYAKDGNLQFRLWTNAGRRVRKHSYDCILVIPSYRETERQTVPNVARAAARDFKRLIEQQENMDDWNFLILLADGTHKDKAIYSMTGPWFLDVENDTSLKALQKKFSVHFASLVTEDSGIFPSISGETDVRGKGSQFETAFYFARYFALKPGNDESKYVMCIDGDLENTDGYVYKMCMALNEGFSYLTPMYWRYKYEGRITNHVVAPLFAALTGTAVRQPIGGEFAFDGKMLRLFAGPRPWQKVWRDFGIDIGMTMTAASSGHTIGQVLLSRKINYVGEDARHQVGDMFVQVTRSLFNSSLNLPRDGLKKDIKSLLIAPIVEIEPVSKSYKNTKISDGTEIVNAMLQFLTRHKRTAYQQNVNLILGDDLTVRLNQIRLQYQDSLDELTNFKNLSQINQMDVVNDLLSRESQITLNSSTWAEIVIKCWERFSQATKEQNKDLCSIILEDVLLCVFFLRVFTFNVLTFDKSTEEAEELLLSQTSDFHRIAIKRSLHSK